MPPRTTDRSITTCRNCRRRKIRCDRGRPRCNRCRESGSTCVYEDQVPQRTRSYQFVNETPGAALREAFDAGEASTTTVPIPLDRLQTIESHVENLTQMLQTLSTTRSDRMTQGAGSRSRGSSSSRGPNSANLRATPPAEVRYVDLSSLTLFCDEVAELGDLLSNQARSLLSSAQNSPVATHETLRRPSITPRTVSDTSTSTEALVSPIEADPLINNPFLGHEMHPPDIDWAYLDEVLRGNEGKEEQQGSEQPGGGEGGPRP